MCLGLVRENVKLAEGSEEDRRRVWGDRAGSSNRATIPGGTWDGEDGVGMAVRTYLDLGPTALRLGSSTSVKVFFASLDFGGKRAFLESFPPGRCLGRFFVMLMW